MYWRYLSGLRTLAADASVPGTCLFLVVSNPPKPISFIILVSSSSSSLISTVGLLSAGGGGGDADGDRLRLSRLYLFHPILVLLFLFFFPVYWIPLRRTWRGSTPRTTPSSVIIYVKTISILSSFQSHSAYLPRGLRPPRRLLLPRGDGERLRER